MNKKTFRIIAFFLLIMFLVKLVFPINIVFAIDNLDSRSSPKEEEDTIPSEDIFENTLFDGLVRMKQDMEPEPADIGSALLMIIPNMIVSIVKLIADAINFLIKFLVPERIVNYPGTENGDFINNSVYVEKFTLDKLFFGDIDFLNANFFDYGDDETHLNTIIKKNVAEWYFIISGIALIMLIGIMIYLAINMVLVYSGLRTPQKHATIKETMINIVVSLAMIFLLPIILSIISNFNDALVKLFVKLRINLVNSYAEENFEIMIPLMSFIIGGLDGGVNSLMYNLTYILLTVIYLRFIIVYIKRFYTLGFLTIISPFIAVTYSADKLKDDKSQVLSKFYREYFYACFLQPLHCFMYIVFIGALGGIASISPIMGLLLLSMFGRVEKIVKGMFDGRDLMVIRSSEEFLKKEN